MIGIPPHKLFFSTKLFLPPITFSKLFIPPHKYCFFFLCIYEGFQGCALKMKLSRAVLNEISFFFCFTFVYTVQNDKINLSRKSRRGNTSIYINVLAAFMGKQQFLYYLCLSNTEWVIFPHQN